MKTWLLGVVVAFVVAGCSGTAANGSSGAGPVSGGCVTVMKPLLDAEQDIDSRLGVGLAFAAYSDKVGGVKVEYDKVVAHMKDVDADCIARVGKPAEDALNQYVTAYSTWNDCIKKSGCTTDSIQSSLQTNWTSATASIKAAEGAMPAGS